MMVQSGGPAAGFIAATTVGDCVDQAAAQWSNDAVVFPDERATYPEFARRSDDFARLFFHLGVASGDKVGIRMEQGIDYYAALVGAAKVGGVGVPINVRFKSAELAYVVANSDMRVLMGSPDGGEVGEHRQLLEDAFPSLSESPDKQLSLAEAPQLRSIYVNGRAGAAWELDVDDMAVANASVSDEALNDRRLTVRIRDTAVLMYTSGTTANPKGAMLSHEALVREGLTVARTRFSLNSHDVMWTPLPLYHIGGIAFAFACFAVGATYCHNGRFDPGVGARQLRDERCTIAIPAFEMLWMAVLDHPDFDIAAMPRLRLIFNVGVPERLRQLQERTPNVVQVSGFGSTEACSFMTLGEVGDSLEDRITTTGRPLPGLEVKIVDHENGELVEPGVVGEILYRGWSVFDGYYNDPDQTEAAFDEGRWFHSGDLGSMDRAGRLQFAGRLKDMMKVGGENVAAAEVEGFLLRHEAVAVAQVVAAPDARYSEVPAAFVQLAPGATVSEDEIVSFCLGAIATFKVPRYVRFVEEWPMSGTKVKKYVLRDQIAAELAAAGITEAPKLSTSR
ncbi:MAG: AMP-binding protein [bacterium]|nr:AMP-binding protein [bacterium]